jgi:hypothetical protein
MDELWTRIVENFSGRISGPMQLRFLLQPLMASIFAVRSGLQDARTGKPPYFWALVTSPDHRREMIRDGWQSVGKIFIIALVLDVVYQLAVLRFLYVGEALLVAFLLALAPYLLLRGLVTRLARPFVPRRRA